MQTLQGLWASYSYFNTNQLLEYNIMSKIDPTKIIKLFVHAFRFQHYDPSLLKRCIINLPQKPLPTPFYAELYTKLLETDLNYNREAKVELDRIISASTRESSIFQRLEIGSLRLKFRLETGITCSKEALQLQEQILKKEITLTESAALNKLLVTKPVFLPQAYLRCLRSIFLMLEEYLAKQISWTDSFTAWTAYSKSNVLYSSTLRNRIVDNILKHLDEFTLMEMNRICYSVRHKHVDMLRRMEDFENKSSRKRLLRMAINNRIGERNEVMVCGKYAQNYTEALESLQFAKGYFITQPYMLLLPYDRTNFNTNTDLLQMKIDGTYEILIQFINSLLSFEQYFIPLKEMSLILRLMRGNIFNTEGDILKKKKSPLTEFQQINILLLFRKYNLEQKALLEQLICQTLNRAVLNKLSLSLFDKQINYNFAANILKILILDQPNPLECSFIQQLLQNNSNQTIKHIKALFNFVKLMNTEKKETIKVKPVQNMIQIQQIDIENKNDQNIQKENKLRDVILSKNRDKGHLPYLIYWVKHDSLRAKWVNFCSDKNISEQTLERKWDTICKQLVITKEVYLQPGLIFTYAIFNKTTQHFSFFVELRTGQPEPYLLETPPSHGKILKTSYRWREMFIKQFFGKCNYVVARDEQELDNIICNQLDLLIQ